MKSSAIIEHLRPVPGTRTSYLGYFFFDFKDTAKQDKRALLSSLLIQLSAQSDSCFKILFDVYSAHDRGSQQPNEDALLQCLKRMLAGLGELPTYIIVDAVDECPNTSKGIGAPRSRQEVMKALKELVELRLPNLHICATSRPEFDIKNVLEKSASFKLSLHDEDGQKQDIAEYVRSVVYSEEEPVMMKWREEVKHSVIERLSEKADGMYECHPMLLTISQSSRRFRWVVCQLEALRDCPVRNVERVLSELPESLDETYERVLHGINKSNREDVYRLLQCLVVSIRPLRVEELAEVLAVDFDSGEEIPKLKPDWRWEDQEQALEAACSSLIAIVDIGSSRVVQFSHFSVKEFLTSPRLADSRGDISRYHIPLGPAHTILAQACVGVLLRLDDRVDITMLESSFPLAQYAAEHWVKHAQFEKALSRIRKGMEDLFNPDRPHFAAWRMLHDIETEPSFELPSPHPSFSLDDSKPEDSDWNATPLYYAALCGFHDLAKHLIINHPQHVNARGGHHYIAPLDAALVGKYFQIAELLFQHGADVDVRRGGFGWTPLLSASLKADPEAVEWLLNHGAHTNVRLNQTDLTVLHLVALLGNSQVARMLLEHKADINAQSSWGHTPLHLASLTGNTDFAELLLGHGVDANARDHADSTPLHLASGKEGKLVVWLERPSLEVVCLLLKHGADMEARDREGWTAFQYASTRGLDDIAKLLLEHGAK